MIVRENFLTSQWRGIRYHISLNGISAYNFSSKENPETAFWKEHSATPKEVAMLLGLYPYLDRQYQKREQKSVKLIS